MAMTQDHYNLIAALADASDVERDPTPGCPSGRSKWHSAARLMDEQGLLVSETDLHRLARHLTRKGMVVSRTVLAVTRWALTEDGLRVARAGRRAARQLAAQGSGS